MAAVTSTGTGTPTTLLVSSAASVALPHDTSTSLFQAANATVTGAGHTCVIIGRTSAAQNDIAQVDISVDGTSVYNDVAGQQIIVKTVLAPGSHTITYTAYALNTDNTMLAAGLVVLDLGL